MSAGGTTMVGKYQTNTLDTVLTGATTGKRKTLTLVADEGNYGISFVAAINTSGVRVRVMPSAHLDCELLSYSSSALPLALLSTAFGNFVTLSHCFIVMLVLHKLFFSSHILFVQLRICASVYLCIFVHVYICVFVLCVFVYLCICVFVYLCICVFVYLCV
jgi:hypothetical protein